MLASIGIAMPSRASAAPPVNKLFSLANTIQSRMVIQQDRPYKIWGIGVPGTEIFVKADWMKSSKKSVCNSNGEWLISIPVPKAKARNFTAHTILVEAGDESILLTDILIGEVWICSGQSNMDMEIKPFIPWLKGALNYEQEIASANYPAIRLYNVRSDFKVSPTVDCVGGAWKICSPETAGDFSAVAYFYARELYTKMQVPVGLVVSSIGASSCQAWTSLETLKSDSVLEKKYWYPYDTSAASKVDHDSVVTFEKVVMPTLLYNSMIYPLRNISARGFLWYQGESNKEDGQLYTRLCKAMVQNWRTLFSRNDMPFYYVQVAPYNWEKNDSTAYNYALFREAQDAIRYEVKHSGMAVTMDIGEPDDIHPRNKQDVGLRLAKLALDQTYGIKTIHCGPEFERMEVEGNRVKVFYKKGTLGSGLVTSDSAAPKHFYVAGPDKVFHPASATIVNNQVWVSSDKVIQPLAIRYAFTNYPVTNLSNKEGLPALPFRSDK